MHFDRQPFSRTVVDVFVLDTPESGLVQRSRVSALAAQSCCVATEYDDNDDDDDDVDVVDDDDDNDDVVDDDEYGQHNERR